MNSKPQSFMFLCSAIALSMGSCIKQENSPTDNPTMDQTSGERPSAGPASTATASGAGCEGHDPTPAGDISDYPLAAGANIKGTIVAKPLACEQESAYVRIDRPSGARRLGTARSVPGGFDEGCMDLPANAQDLAQCPVINPGAILRSVYERLAAQGMKPNGVGVGPCGTLDGPYETLNMAVGVTDWRNAEAAVNMVADMLSEYDVKGFVGVAVRGVACGEDK